MIFYLFRSGIITIFKEYFWGVWDEEMENKKLQFNYIPEIITIRLLL